MKRTFSRAAPWALAVLLGLSSVSAQPRPGPRAWVQTRHATINRILEAPAASPLAADRDRRVAALLDGMLDLDELSRRALEPHWEQRTPEEQREFVGLLRQLIDRNYQQNLTDTLGYDVRYPVETVAPSGEAVVRSEARSRTDPRAPVVRIEYRLRPQGNGWVVTDLVTNGSSLVQSYHDSYTRIIRDRGFPELLNRMRQRIREPASRIAGRATTP